jgi:rare lipoprotein A
MTCANLKLKFFTKVLVEDPKTGKSVIVKVNDRGPYACKRVMDLSKGAATSLGTISRGVAYVDCTVIDADSDKK